jgi:hypothetical protein
MNQFFSDYIVNGIMVCTFVFACIIGFIIYSVNKMITRHNIQYIKGYDYRTNHTKQIKDICDSLCDINFPVKLTLRPKPTSNIFRDHKPKGDNMIHLNLQNLSAIYDIDTTNNIATVGGMTRFDQLVDATLAKGLIPQVVPELVSITVGGAVTGIGFESSSWKYGFVHQTIAKMKILLSDGLVRTTCPGNRLYNAMANSYGTLGYIVEAQVKLVPISSHTVRIDIQPYNDIDSFTVAMNNACISDDWMFVDGVSFSENSFVLVLATTCDNEVHSDNNIDPCINMFYECIRTQFKKTFTMSIRDYLFRWDPDGFFSTLQLPSLIRKPWFRKMCHSAMRSDVMRDIAHEYKPSIEKMVGFFGDGDVKDEVLQDLGVDMLKCAEFFRDAIKDISLFPIWFCPITTRNDMSSLWNLKIEKSLENPLQLACDVGFGFGVSKTLPKDAKPGHYIRLLEEKMIKFSGQKGLYSTSLFSPEVFWSKVIHRDIYDSLKKEFDPQSRFYDIYEKVCTNII